MLHIDVELLKDALQAHQQQQTGDHIDGEGAEDEEELEAPAQKPLRRVVDLTPSAPASVSSERSCPQ